jgi:uncharacterized protein YkwD
MPLVDERVIRQLHAMHNNARIDHKKPLLELSDDLSRVAQAYAILLQRTGRSAHDLDGLVSNRLARAGYRFAKCGENLANAGPLIDHESIFQQWLDSPNHLANMMGPFREMGIGYHGTMWVVVFATPLK